MNLKFLLIPLLLMSYTPTTHADDGLDISYKVPFLPLEIVFDSDGISFHGTKTIVTPIGSFSLGYSKYASKFEEDYTYVIIEDMNLKKEHIYKINDKKKLKLVSEGRTEITITKNRVRITVEKGSHFTVKFSVVGEDESEQSSSSSSKWITPSNSTCRNHGGKVDSDGCKANWVNAKNICSASGGSLPTIDELRKVVTDCGGEMEEDNSAEWERNEKNTSYQSCSEKKGFTFGGYWSATTYVSDSSDAWNVGFDGGDDGWGSKTAEVYIRCVRGGQ